MLLTAVGVALAPGLARAGETDLLVKKLVDKGILTPYEAQILQDDIRQDVSKQNAKATNDAIPSWVQKTAVKGDLRLRYQTQQREGATTRNRGRIRYRLGLESKPNDKFRVGAGLASAEKVSSTNCTTTPCTVSNGVDDSRSTNQTMSNAFDRGAIRLDYAFAEYLVNNNVRVIGGKYNASGKGYLWYTTDMLWDSDINQEGASADVTIPVGTMAELFVNGGYWVLDEASSSASDLGMYYAQVGTKVDLDPVVFTAAGTFYGLHGTTETGVLDGRASGNTTTGSGTSTRYAYDWGQVYAASAELAYNFPEETSSPVKTMALFGDYVMNPDPSDNNTGYAAGLKFGHKKVGAMRGDWQFKYQYVRLAKDAWLDAFPDSDRYSGNTNIKGHEWILDIGLAKNVSLGLDYYRTDVLKGMSQPEHILQTDISFKF